MPVPQMPMRWMRRGVPGTAEFTGPPAGASGAGGIARGAYWGGAPVTSRVSSVIRPIFSTFPPRIASMTWMT